MAVTKDLVSALEFADLRAYCSRREKDMRKVGVAKRRGIYDVAALLSERHNCTAYFVTLTWPRHEGSLEAEWASTARFFDWVKGELSQYCLVVGGLISLEAHKNTTTKAKRGKNTKAGRPHAHMVLWLCHEFLNPSRAEISRALGKCGMSCNLKVLDRHEATVKALLYTSKDGSDEDLQSFVRAVTPWPKSVNLWINHADCVELLGELEMHLGVGTVFVTEELYNKFPTARKTSDDTIMLAEIFVQLFQQQGLGVRDSTVYRRRQGCRFTWEPWMSLDSWLNLFFDLRMPPAFLSKLRQNVLWLQKEGATSKNMPRLDLFPRLHLTMNYVEFTDCLYDFTLGQTLVTPALNTTICSASNTDCEFAACRPPYQLLGLLSVLTGWGRNESAKGRTLVSTLPSNSEELSSDERFAKACASHYLEKENRLLKALCAIGGIFHPRLNRKDNPALYLTGEPSTYKTFLARLVLDTVYGFDHIDIISRSRSRFNLSSLRKSDGSPYVLLMDDSRWGELGLALADFLNLLDGGKVATEAKYQSKEVGKLQGSLVMTSNEPVSTEFIREGNYAKALKTRLYEAEFFPFADKSLEPSRETLIDMHEEAMGFSILANALFLASRGGRKLSIPDSFRDKIYFSAEREPLPFVGAMLLKDLVHFVDMGHFR